jgi:hypothetical protein
MPNTTATREGLQISERQRMQQAGNAVAGATARSNVNPVAAARMHAAVTMNERASMQQQRAAMEAQARTRDIGRGLGLASSLLGFAIGGPGGMQAGQAVGNMAGSAIGGAVAPGGDAGKSLASAVPQLGSMLPNFMGGMTPQSAVGGLAGAQLPAPYDNNPVGTMGPTALKAQMMGQPQPQAPAAPVMPAINQQVQQVAPQAQASMPQQPMPPQANTPAMPQQALTPPPQPAPPSQTMMPAERSRQQFLMNRTQGLGNTLPQGQQMNTLNWLWAR